MAKLTKAVDTGAPDAGSPSEEVVRPPDRVTTEHVVAHVRALIEKGELRPGDRLPPERELAVQIGVSRPSVRAGLQALSAMGVVQARHGAGTFITDGPPTLATGPLSFMAALHGFTKEEMFEARRVLEVGAVRLAAERATGQDLAAIAEEMAGMFASLDQPLTFLVHDITFHRAIAHASHNPILASLIEMVSAMFYEQRKANVGAVRDLREAAEMHRAIYQALRDHDGDAAQAAMSEHLRIAAAFKGNTEVPMGTPQSGGAFPESGTALHRTRAPARPTDVIRHVGILGGGGISETHARAAAAVPDLRVVAVCGRDAGRVEALAARHDAVPFTDLHAFLRHRPDGDRRHRHAVRRPRRRRRGGGRAGPARPLREAPRRRRPRASTACSRRSPAPASRSASSSRIDRRPI